MVHDPAIIERLTLEALERCAVLDPVMGLFNRQYLDAALERELRRRSRRPLGLALLMLDLDGFKGVNDRHGHLCGDWILRELGALIRKQLRGGDLACRFGGDEVAIILPDASKAEAVTAAERIRVAVEQELGRDVLPATTPLTISGGLATFSSRARTPDALLQQADGALYRAKRAGGKPGHRCGRVRRAGAHAIRIHTASCIKRRSRRNQHLATYTRRQRACQSHACHRRINVGPPRERATRALSEARPLQPAGSEAVGSYTGPTLPLAVHVNKKEGDA